MIGIYPGRNSFWPLILRSRPFVAVSDCLSCHRFLEITFVCGCVSSDLSSLHPLIPGRWGIVTLEVDGAPLSRDMILFEIESDHLTQGQEYFRL